MFCLISHEKSGHDESDWFRNSFLYYPNQHNFSVTIGQFKLVRQDQAMKFKFQSSQNLTWKFYFYFKDRSLCRIEFSSRFKLYLSILWVVYIRLKSTRENRCSESKNSKLFQAYTLTGKNTWENNSLILNREK